MHNRVKAETESDIKSAFKETDYLSTNTDYEVKPVATCEEFDDLSHVKASNFVYTLSDLRYQESLSASLLWEVVTKWDSEKADMEFRLTAFYELFNIIESSLVYQS